MLLLHGVNFVAKVDGETPAEMGFGDDDAQFLADNGFDVVRLGLTAGSIMPSPGVIDTAYLAFRQTIDTITGHGLLVLVDLHQDGWGPSLGSDGFPEWMTITHGAENTHTGFPLYYITNPAIQAAFDSFWGNEAGPESIGIQDRVGTMMAALAESVGNNSGVLGYDLLNEPWPGTVWQPCRDRPHRLSRAGQGTRRLQRAHGRSDPDPGSDPIAARRALRALQLRWCTHQHHVAG